MENGLLSVNRTSITSRANPLLRQARAVRDGKVPDRIFVEGLRLCEEAADSGLPIEVVLHTPEFKSEDRGAGLLGKLSARAAEVGSVGERVFVSIADTKTPQRIIIIAARPETSRQAFES